MHNLPTLNPDDRQNQLTMLETVARSEMEKSRKTYTTAILCLYEIHKRRLYKLKAETFIEYLRDEWGLSRKSTVYAHLAVVKPFYSLLTSEDSEPPDFDRLKRGFQLASMSNESAFEIYNNAKNLPENAFNNEIAELSGGTATDSCSHENTTTKIMKHCKDCGQFLGSVEGQ